MRRGALFFTSLPALFICWLNSACDSHSSSLAFLGCKTKDVAIFPASLSGLLAGSHEVMLTEGLWKTVEQKAFSRLKVFHKIGDLSMTQWQGGLEGCNIGWTKAHLCGLMCSPMVCSLPVPKSLLSAIYAFGVSICHFLQGLVLKDRFFYE